MIKLRNLYVIIHVRSKGKNASLHKKLKKLTNDQGQDQNQALDIY